MSNVVEIPRPGANQLSRLSVSAEPAVIAGLLREPSLWSQARVTAGDFMLPNTRAVFLAISDLVDLEQERSAELVGAHMDASGHGPRSAEGDEDDEHVARTWTSYCLQLAYGGALGALSNWHEYQAHMLRWREKRELARIGAALIAGQIEPTDCMRELVELSGGALKARALTDSSAGADAFVAELERSASGHRRSWGYASLDKLLGGVHRGRLYVIGGRPKMGKTAFGLNLALRIARAGTPGCVGFVTVEQSAAQLSGRAIAIENGIDLHYATSYPGPTMIERLRHGALNVPKLLFYDQPGATAEDVERAVRQWWMRGQAQVVVIDYLQRIRPVKERESERLNIGGISTAFADLARELDISILLLAQVRRDVDQRKVVTGFERIPHMSDFAESGAIERDADTAITLDRPELHLDDDLAAERGLKGLALVNIAANRHGPAGLVRMRFEGHCLRFVDAQDAPGQEEARW